MITITFDYFENCISLQIITITDYDYPSSADLSLCWSHIQHCWKSHALAQLYQLVYFRYRNYCTILFSALTQTSSFSFGTHYHPMAQEQLCILSLCHLQIFIILTLNPPVTTIVVCLPLRLIFYRKKLL